MSKPWLVINSGKTPITKGVIGKMGGEKPHISFWIDEKEDIRVAIWENKDGSATFQVTRKNHLLDTPDVVESKEDQLPISTPGANQSQTKVEDDDLPF
jgi:hypothetical protein